MKVEIELAERGTATHTAEKITWQFVDGHVEIYAEEKMVATYRLDQVLWVRDLEGFDRERSIT